MQDTLDAIEFARGDASSTMGSARAAMGHPEPFDLQYVAAGNQDCWKKNYRGMPATALAHIHTSLRLDSYYAATC